MKAPSAILCLTGSELTRGETLDTNGPFLSIELTALGFRVVEIRLLPDDREELEESLRTCIRKADLVIVSGGLGPTADDVTALALARVVGRGVHEDPEARARMRERVLLRVGSDAKIPPNYYKQAEVVDGSKVFLNPVGLAPGFAIETERGMAVAMPGVPRELEAMFRECVLPEIRRRFPTQAARLLSLMILGHGESWVESRIQNLGIDFARVEYGIRARPGEIKVRFLVRRQEDFDTIDDIRERMRDEFGEDMILVPDAVAGESGKVEQVKIVHERLVASGYTVSTAESCTGGLIAKRLTDYAGSSTYFLGSIVAYDNAVKQHLLGVDPELLASHGAVSAPVCRAMALGIKERMGTDYGLATTGIAGPGGGTEAKPVGLVFIGLALPDASTSDDGTNVLVLKHQFPGNRDVVRLQAAARGLDMIRRDIARRRR